MHRLPLPAPLLAFCLRCATLAAPAPNGGACNHRSTWKLSSKSPLSQVEAASPTVEPLIRAPAGFYGGGLLREGVWRQGRVRGG